MPNDALVRVTRAVLESQGAPQTEVEGRWLDEASNDYRTWGQVASALIPTRALDRHAKALNESAKAAQVHARQLAWATWALVGATIVLAVVAAVEGRA